ncbi:TonB-dependent receptor domain-containing protein [Thermomonas hydrothermalis]|uniref:TonB-dependent Receptor Plug Domain n=1 Tax=Thermomonas hydrothermalis TaxID=213588 RepID=A0A1M4XGF5_9GAMM|nr:TonB-dependent receptor [Thermomonas hydrothermalis]SHE92579.1 TonB-dependent Receptor Plug Domain [Thermomonas hydrothermalis]
MKKAQSARLRQLPLFIAVLGCLYGMPALAQDSNADKADQAKQQEEAKKEPKELDKVVVTGSLIKRLEYDTISPVQVISADISIDVGQISTAELLQKSSVAAGSTQISNQFAGFVVEGGTGVQTINLRGLGAQRTAVLLNGQRPGPAGTRGQVLAFDLNVIPQSILQRAEIVKDGSSSIYGSDAVAGVVNLITRKNFTSPEFTFLARNPQKGGYETVSLSFANGWDFGKGTIAGAVEYYLQEPLRFRDRDFLRCAEDLVWDQNGNRIDRQDRSILAGTPLGGCTAGNLYANTVIDAVYGRRYIPSPDGTTIGLIPGYRPRTNTGYSAGNTGQAYYEDVLNFDFFGEQQLIDRQERFSLFTTADFNLGPVNWTTDFLYNRRGTDTHRWRQFFPLTGGTTATRAAYKYTDGSSFASPVPSGIAQPIMPFPSDQKVRVNYYYLRTGLDGLIGGTETWSWSANLSYTRSDGDYSALSILKSKSGDADPALRPWTGGKSPSVNYFDPCFLSGACMSQLVQAVGQWHTGNTVYDQYLFNATATGELFQLPAGAVNVAIGGEYRNFGINDQPSQYERNGDLWGQSSAVVTKGRDHVKELFTEVEVPLLKGLPAIESLTMNLSARAFDYASVGKSDSVWKLGLGWQVIPSLRLRATKGTSYRAPGLYELYLGNLSSFVSQTSIDPCINWGQSTNDYIRANCAAAGIPDNFAGATSSATVITQGGAGVLKPETSNAKTAGLVFTPTSIPFSLAVDYFEYTVRDQIARLTAATILGGCYGAQVYPNQFCSLFVRNPPDHPTAPNKIETVYQKYVNVNRQKVRGYDLLTRYDGDFSFGKLEVEGQATYVMEDFEEFFSTSAASGFSSSNRNGAIGRPKLVGNLRTTLKRGDWSWTWYMNYVGETKSLTLSPTFTYFGWTNAVRDIVAESRLYHTLSVRYDQPKWSVLFGIQNVTDKDPPTISSGVDTRYGNVPAFATQYDLLGRTFYTQLSFKF